MIEHYHDPRQGLTIGGFQAHRCPYPEALAFFGSWTTIDPDPFSTGDEGHEEFGGRRMKGRKNRKHAESSRRRITRIMVLAALCVAAASPGLTRGKAPVRRPRIGLVLSGGGARGAAHAGILEVLEELHVPVDIVTGTSMGALVGGLYASGKTPEEILDILYNMDWSSAFKDKPPRNRLSFRRKTDEDGYFVKATVGVRKGKIIIPKGAVQGQTITHLLRTFTLPVACVRDFDRLPTPFRCVAADIVSGEPVVLSSGDLALSMRASMSIPGVFEPVRIGKHLLVDGGIANNLPVNVARQMGADVIIAVDISTPMSPEENLKTALSILDQVSTLLTRRTTETQIKSLKTGDVLIVPDLGKITSADFDKAREAVLGGEKAARQASDLLRRFAVSPEEYERWQKRRRRRMGCGAEPVVDEIRVVNDSRLANTAINEHLHVKPGQQLDSRKLAIDLQDIYGLGVFDIADYELGQEAGKTVLTIRTHESSTGPGTLRFALDLESDIGRQSKFNLGVRYTRMLLNRWGGEYRLDLNVGSHPEIRFELYQPLDGGMKWFVAPYLFAEQNTFNVVAEGRELFTYRIKDAALGVDAGRILGNWAELRLGIFSGTSRGDLLVGLPILPHARADVGVARFQFNVDTVDRLVFPRKGFQVRAELLQSLTALGAEEAYLAESIKARGAFTLGRITVEATTILGDTDMNHPNSNPVSLYSLGGFLRLSGYFPDEFLGGRVAFGSLNVRRRMNNVSGLLSMPVYVGASLETGNATVLGTPLGWNDLHTAGSLYLGVDSVLGPLYLAVGWGEGGRSQYYFFLGQIF